MDRRDRKRAFSEAFQPASKKMRNPIHQAIQNIAASSADSTPSIFYTPAVSFSSNKENETPFLPGKGTAPVAPGAPLAGFQQQQGFAPLAYKPSMNLPHRGDPLQDLSKQLSFPRASHPTTSMPPTSQHQIRFNSSPSGSTVNSSSPLNEVLDSSLDSGPGPIIYEDPDTVMCDQLVPVCPPTPSELNLQDLTLLDDPERPLLALSNRAVAQLNRVSVYVVPSTMFDGCFPSILPNEVVISFNKGKHVIKIDKYPLSNESRFFAQMLDGAFLDSYTRCIRLRGDFPYGIKAMLEFIDTGIYIFDPNMRVQYPNITLLDLHIHAYLVGSKYDVPNLCDYAIDQYINLGEMILSLGFATKSKGPSEDASDPVSTTSMDTQNPASVPTYAALQDPNDCSPATVTDRFLDSLVLLWKNTPNRHDPMRAAVLELVKTNLNSLMRVHFFITLMLEMVGFGDDIVHSLEEDGLDVRAFSVPAHLKRKWTVRFGGA